MRPTFLGFETSRKGLTVAQKALDITGHNMSNMSTPGYTRQRIDQVSMSAYGYQSRFGGSRVDFSGQGVDITGVSQTRNSFLDRRFREEFSDNYYYQQRVDILGDISSIVDQYAASDGGLLTAINTISDALQNLSGDKSTNRANANILHTAFQGMVQTLHDYDAKLDKIANQQKYDLTVSVTEVNNMLAKLAGLNKEIVDEVAVNPSEADVYGPNELLDERNLLLDELSRYANLDVVEEENGALTVRMGGHVAVNGLTGTYETINYIDRGNTVGISWQSDGSAVTAPSGALKAFVEMINGRGPNLQSQYESPEKGILYYRDRMNTFAQALADTMNNILPGALDETGEPVADAGYKSLLVSSDGDDTPITAKNIDISDAWNQDVGYVLPSETSLKNSDYFQKMNAALKTDSSTVFTTWGISTTSSFSEYVEDMHNTCVGEESFYQGRLDATGAVADQLLNERDSVSGVNKDEETSNMLMYQKSFQAMARMMTTMDDLLDQIINHMGRVGL